MRHLLLAALLLVAGCGGGASSDDSVDTAGWRTEVWGGLALDVPAEWGWGTAPIGLPEPALCGDPDPAAPYVGRPVPTADVCTAVDQLETPGAPYVWLGSVLDPGTESLGDGWVRETVAAHGTVLSVASDDPALRRAVLASVRPQDVCDADPVASEPHLCAYSSAGLAHYAELPAADARELADALAQADLAPCPGKGDVVFVAGGGLDARLRLACGVPPSVLAPLTRHTGLRTALASFAAPGG